MFTLGLKYNLSCYHQSPKLWCKVEGYGLSLALGGEIISQDVNCRKGRQLFLWNPIIHHFTPLQTSNTTCGGEVLLNSIFYITWLIRVFLEVFGVNGPNCWKSDWPKIASNQKVLSVIEYHDCELHVGGLRSIDLHLDVDQEI